MWQLETWTNVCWSRTALNMLLSGRWILLSRSSQTCSDMFPVIKGIRNVKCHKMYQHKFIRSRGSSLQFFIGYVNMQICVLNWERLLYYFGLRSSISAALIDFRPSWNEEMPLYATIYVFLWPGEGASMQSPRENMMDFLSKWTCVETKG